MYFNLGTSENSRFVNIIRILFGLVCVAVAIFWLKFNIRSTENNGTLWITIIFLTGFGFFQVCSGLGYTSRYIEIENDNIRLKRNALLSSIKLLPGEIERIESLPLSIIFLLKTKKRILLRFGTTYYEANEKIIENIILFADANQIPFEIIEEEL